MRKAGIVVTIQGYRGLWLAEGKWNNT